MTLGIAAAEKKDDLLGTLIRSPNSSIALWARMGKNTDKLDAQRQYMVIGTLALHLIFYVCDFLCEQGSGPGGDRRG